MKGLICLKKILLLLLCLALALSLCACETLQAISEIPLPSSKNNEPVVVVSGEETATPEPQKSPEPEPVAAPEESTGPEEADIELSNQVIVSIAETKLERMDPQNGTQLILTFSYETPTVFISGRDEASAAIQTYLDRLSETYYTGGSFEADEFPGFNEMLTDAEINYTQAVETGEDLDLEFSAIRTARVERADNAVLSFVYSDSTYTGIAPGSDRERGYVFDTETGERLTLAKLTNDFDAFRTFLAEYLVTAGGGNEAELSSKAYEEIVNGLLNNGSWYFTNSGLVIFSIEPEADETLWLVDLPYSELDGLMDEKWVPAAKRGVGEFAVSSMSDVENGTVEIIDLVAVGDADEEFCLKVDGTVYDVKISSVHYTDAFYETAQLWYASYMSNCAIQLQAPLPDGMPALMISYTTDHEQHNILLTHGEGGGPALVDDSIEAVG